jgi:hypothetical protein
MVQSASYITNTTIRSENNGDYSEYAGFLPRIITIAMSVYTHGSMFTFRISHPEDSRDTLLRDIT